MSESEKKLWELDSFKKLKTSIPPDLTKGLMTLERVKRYKASGSGLKLLYAAERVDDQILKTLFDLAKECGVYKKMQSMQSGDVINCIKGYPSENRAVLHTATRDFFNEKASSKPAKEARELAKAECDKLQSFMQEIDGKFTTLFMIGIGGSDLGPQAIYMGLEHLLIEDRTVRFINNIDPDSLALAIKDIDLQKALAVVVSKSGSTIETKTNEEFLRSEFVKKGVDPKQHFIAVTGEGSEMDNTEKYLKVFYIWDWIGGRYSSTSMVGGVLLSFAFGFDAFFEVLKGASQMDKGALIEDPAQNLPLLGALFSVWNRNFLKLPTLAIIPYSQGLSRFPAHIQQVSMESNGKHIDRFGNAVPYDTGMVIWGEPGTNAQHSFFQLIHQGTEVVPLEFIGFVNSRIGLDFEFDGCNSQQKLIANLIAQSIALATGQKSDNPNKEFKGNRPSHIIVAEELTPFSIGTLLSYFEHKVAFEGFIWNINSFDQEGVQLGKHLANKVLERMKGEGASYPVADAYMDEFFHF